MNDLNLRYKSQDKWLINIVALAVVLFMNWGRLRGVTSDVVMFLGSPFLMTANRIHSWSSDVVSYFKYSRELYESYIQLQNDFELCKADQAEYAVLKDENDALKSQLGMNISDYTLVEGLVILLPDELDSTIVLNKGKADSVSVGDFVVRGSAYVGRVSEVTDSYSVVSLPSSNKSISKVFISKKEDGAFIGKAVVNGDGANIKISNIVGNGVAVGDRVYIADGDSKYYFLLGEIAELNEDPALPTPYGVVVPAVNTSVQKVYFILTSETQ